MTRARLFLWISIAFAAVCFVGALATAIPLASRIRLQGSDEARSDELLVEAREKLEAGDQSGARKLIDRILAANPGDPLARSDLARILKGQGDYPSAIAQDKIAIATAPDLPDLYYNVACYYALEKRKEDALVWLAGAFSHGFGRLEQMRGDPDLASLAGDLRFQLASRTGKFPDGTPRVSFHADQRRAKAGEPLELDLVVERDVPAGDASRESEALKLSFIPDPPVELSNTQVKTLTEGGGGVTTVRTTARYIVRSSRPGIFAVPPVKVVDGAHSLESESLEVEIE